MLSQSLLKLNMRQQHLSAAILIILSSTTLLSACGGGGGGGTDRISTTGNTTVEEKTYPLAIHSQVEVKNAKVRLIDAATDQVIAEATLAQGSTFNFDVKQSNARNKLLIAELSGIDATSTYYDPTLDKQAPLNATLHAAFVMPDNDLKMTISPFTEIAYRRALVRAGNMDPAQPDNKLLAYNVSANTNTNANDAAINETRLAFRLYSALPTPDIASKADLNKFLYNASGIQNPPNTQDQYLNMFFSIGHYMIQHTENPSDPTPYLTFAKRAAEDMRDGSLDGLTIMGDGTNAGIRLSNSIISNIRSDGSLNINRDPANNTAVKTAQYQLEFRQNYGTRLKNNILAFLGTLNTVDPAGQNILQSYDYIQSPTNTNISTSAGIHTSGAGNYKRAFGLEPVLLPLYQSADIKVGTYDGTTCNLSNPVKQNNTAGSPDEYAYSTCMSGLNADGSYDGKNDIEGLVGKYTSTEGCKLAIQFNGTITLSKDGQTYTNSINRDISDALIRLSSGPEDYVMNVSSANTNPPQFLQFRISNQVIQSVTAGTSVAQFPTTLSDQKLVCHFNYSL